MTELKTIMDMERVDLATEPTGVYTYELQSAAKEWVEKLDYNHYKELPEEFFDNSNPDHYYDICIWIKHFFNLED